MKLLFPQFLIYPAKQIFQIKEVLKDWVYQVSILIIVLNPSFILSQSLLAAFNLDHLLVVELILYTHVALETTAYVLVVIFPQVAKHPMIQF